MSEEIQRKQDTDRPEELTEEVLRQMAEARLRIAEKWPKEVEVCGRKYSVKQISKAVRRRIHHLELEAYLLSGKQKEAQSLKEAKRISDRLDRLHAKTAAYYLMGNKALFNPLAFAMKWRSIMRETEEVSATINDAAVNQKEINFSLANWRNTEDQLALSMRPVGEGVRQTLKRWEAAQEQIREDATKKKEGESGSEASSRKTPTTKG